MGVALKFYFKTFFFVMSKALSGELSLTQTGIVLFRPTFRSVIPNYGYLKSKFSGTKKLTLIYPLFWMKTPTLSY